MKRFIPQVEQLDELILPAGGFGKPSLGPAMFNPQPPPMPQAARSVVSFDLGPAVDGMGKITTNNLYVHIKAKDGQIYDHVFHVQGANAEVVRDTVHAALTQSGWVVEKSATYGLVIFGKGANKATCSSPTAAKCEAKESRHQPKVIAQSGVQEGQPSAGTAWAIAFTDPNLAGVLDAGATFTLTVDGTAVQVSIAAGSTVQDANQAVYNALVAHAGFSDVTLDSNGVHFLQDATDSEGVQISVELTLNGSAVFGVYLDVADRVV